MLRFYCKNTEAFVGFLTLLQEEYRREGLVFKRVDFVNNDATVALLEGTGGILRTLEDVCRCISFWTSVFIFEA